MKKFLTKFITLVLAVLLFAVAGCSGCKDANWKEDDVTLKDWGKVLSNGGFIAETDNYVYFINGIGDSETDNEFGMPVKGALMAASKADINEGKSANDIEKCVVVPKLFVAQDYKSGLFISGDYVYYGTPVTDKDSTGNAASSEMQFMRTKLDGTDSTEYLKTSSLADEYRFVEREGVVYIVVFDSENTQIICYNTSTQTSTVIAKTDETTEESETLNAYAFVDQANAGDGAIIYTTTVYTEKYQADAAEEANYTRPTAKYNKVYMFKAGDESSKLVLDGSKDNTTYAVSMVKGDYVFYTATKAVSVNQTTTYAIESKSLFEGGDSTKIINADYAVESTLIVSLDEVYVVNAGGDALRKTTLIGSKAENEKTVASVSAVATLLFKNGDFVYYINSENYVARIKIANVDADKVEDVKVQVVSEGTIPTDWYLPEIVDGNLYYSDNSAIGCSYIKFVPVDADAEVIVEGEEGAETLSLAGHVQLCKVDDIDAVPFTEAKINAVTNELENGKLVFDTTINEDGEEVVVLKDGVPTVSAVTEAKELYDGLTDEQKETITAETVELLDKYVEALKLSQAMYKLNNFDNLSTEQKDALRSAYDDVTALMEQIKKDGFLVNDIRAYVVENLNWYYQEAGEYFTAE